MIEEQPPGRLMSNSMALRLAMFAVGLLGARCARMVDCGKGRCRRTNAMLQG
jgi:hypothetical protein